MNYSSGRDSRVVTTATLIFKWKVTGIPVAVAHSRTADTGVDLSLIMLSVVAIDSSRLSRDATAWEWISVVGLSESIESMESMEAVCRVQSMGLNAARDSTRLYRARC